MTISPYKYTIIALAFQISNALKRFKNFIQFEFFTQCFEQGHGN